MCSTFLFLFVIHVCFLFHTKVLCTFIHFEPNCNTSSSFTSLFDNEPSFPWDEESADFKDPSEDMSLMPLDPRVFIQHNSYPFSSQKHYSSLENNRIMLRWKAPETRKPIESYRVHCRFTNEFNYHQYCRSPILENCTLQYETNDVPANSTVHLKVSACISSGCGPATPTINAQLIFENPIPELLISTSTGIMEMDFDFGSSHTLTSILPASPLMDFIYLDHYVVYALDNVITIRSFGPMPVQWEYELNGTVTGLVTDWIGRYIYWAESRYQKSSIVKRLDLSSLRIEMVLLRDQKVISLLIEPLSGLLIWLESDGDHTSLFKSSLTGADITHYFSSNHKKKDGCTCKNNTKFLNVLAIDYMLNDPLLLYVDAETSDLVAADMKACRCESLITLGSSFHPSSISTDFKHVYWFDSRDNKIYSVRKFSDNIRDSMSVHVNYNISHIKSGSLHLQPFPDPHCLLPSNYAYTDVKLLKRTSNSFKLEMPKFSVPQDCNELSLPTLEYSLYYGLLEKYADVEMNMCNNGGHCNTVTTFDTIVDVTDLEPSTNYVFIVQFDNYFRRYLKVEPVYAPHVTFQTATEAPSTVKQVNITLQTPYSISIRWSPISHNTSYWYSVFYNSSTFAKEKVVSPGANMTFDLIKLQPNTSYHVSVRVYAEDTISNSESKPILIRTYPEPSDILLLNKTPYSLSLEWNHGFLYRKCILQHFANQTWQNMTALNNSQISSTLSLNTMRTINPDSHYYFIERLRPKTNHTFRLILLYNYSNGIYYWPQKYPFSVFQTLGDRPRTPNAPTVAIHRVVWEVPDSNGDPISLFWLETRRPDMNWTVCYTGPDSSWKIDSKYLQSTYRFRVKALNAYGWSDFSESSIQFDLSYQEPITSFVAPFGILSATVIIFASICTICVLKCKKTSKNVKGRDYELAHLRCETFVESRNPMYMSNIDYIPTDADIAALPQIKRDQITLTKFLGSGAFGEVFEGDARNLEETRVAVKTLRKGATPQEKLEFLKEALLMSNFKHEHILRLIGVCVQNNPTLIIMELMEGRDLLSYLRSNRPSKGETSCLNLKDLLSMCIDVNKGCKYLEELHFVHRDLAARNCLVSWKDPQKRIVKIGDFGLARDVYRNDYYKKEGEGLLPVRWMAPECLVDGVFSSQSDVWAFGVLLWEIMSLGQQPYPARTNVDVLHYVRSGGRLNRPANSSHLLYSLMLKCWSFQADKRPSFKYCLQILEYLFTISKPLKLQVDSELSLGNHDSSSPPHTELEFNFQDDDLPGQPGYLELLNMEAYYEIPRTFGEGPSNDSEDNLSSLNMSEE